MMTIAMEIIESLRKTTGQLHPEVESKEMVARATELGYRLVSVHSEAGRYWVADDDSMITFSFSAMVYPFACEPSPFRKKQILDGAEAARYVIGRGIS